MPPPTPDNAASTPVARGSASGTTNRAVGIAPQRLNLASAASPSSTISSLTTSVSSRRLRSTTRLRARHHDEILRLTENVPLAELGLSPARREHREDVQVEPEQTIPNEVAFDPIAFENEYDAKAYTENPGAYDSEDEEAQLDDNPLELVNDKNIAHHVILEKCLFDLSFSRCFDLPYISIPDTAIVLYGWGGSAAARNSFLRE